MVADGAVPELLASVVDAALTSDPRVAERRWAALGARARLGGYGDGDFGWVGHALVRAVRDVAGDAWSGTRSSSWMAFHVWMAEFLAAGAAAVAPPVPRAGQAGSAPWGPGVIDCAIIVA